MVSQEEQTKALTSAYKAILSGISGLDWMVPETGPVRRLAGARIQELRGSLQEVRVVLEGLGVDVSKLALELGGR